MTINLRALEVAHDAVWRRQDDARATQRSKEMNTMTKLKTLVGEVDKPQSSDPLRRRVDALYEAAAEVLDTVTEAAKRRERLDNISTVDARRFPAAGGER